MTYRELNDWFHHYMDEPFISDRVEVQLANLSYLIASSNGAKVDIDSFMISSENKKSEEEKLEEKIIKFFGVGENGTNNR